MKSSGVLAALSVLSTIHAFTLPRSQHDGMLRRNFKNVLPQDNAKSRVARSPQGPASNPGEFTNVGLSNTNPANENGGTGSLPDTGSGYVPEPMMDSGTSSSDPIGAPGDISSGSPLPSTTTPPAMDGDIGTVGGSPGITSGVYPYAPSGILTGYPSGATGRHHRHNETGLYDSPGIVEVEIDVEADGEVVMEETLWQFNGTGWNSTDLPVPSGGVIGTLIPRPTPTGGASPSGLGRPGIENGLVRPGFTGPRGRLADDMERNEIAADGTGMEQMGVMTEDDVGMMKGGGSEHESWLSGFLSGWLSGFI